MKKDILLIKTFGFEGIVVGLLKTDGTIDTYRTAKLVRLAYPMEVTFHRAFDRAAEPFQALEEIISCGCQRILTSGQVPNAIDGKELIAQLIQQADERIIVMPGSGVRSNNINELVTYTNAREFHSSARKIIPSQMEFIQKSMEENAANTFIDVEEIKMMKEVLIDSARLKEER